MLAVRLPCAHLGVLSVVFGLLLLTGCGSKNPSGRVAISGKVTLDGAPLEQGSIKFEPMGAPAATGAVNSGAPIENGEYELPEENGLLPGKYRVSISSPEQTGSGTTDPMQAMNEASQKPVGDRVPAKYNVKSELSVDFANGGPTEFNFDLKSI